MAHPRATAIVAALMVAAASLGGWRAGEARRRATVGTVVEVLDGDTIVVALPHRRETVRLLGVDTPEVHHPRKPVQCYGPEASAYTRARLLGRPVRLGFDAVVRDGYGRLLAYVEVGGRRFNDELLRLGYGRLFVVPPNGLHGRAMLDAQLEARRARRGLWGAC